MCQSLIAELFDQEFPVANAEKIALLLEYAKRIKGPVLEGMCGTGRYMLPLWERRLKVDGLDACPFMLERCAKRLRKKNSKATLYQQRIQQIDLPHRYDLIFILHKSLSLVKKEEIGDVFKKIYAHLNPGGFFIFDLWSPVTPNVRHSIEEIREFKKEDGTPIIREQTGSYDPSLYRLCNRYRSIEGKKVREEAFEIQLYDKEKIPPLLQKCGFTLLKEGGQSCWAKTGDFLFLKQQFWFVVSRL